VAWVSLDANDNDPVRFWTYVIAALQMLHPGLGQPALAHLHSVQRLQAESFLIALINAISTHPGDLALVLDDYHVVEEPAIHNTLSYLLEHLPRQIHLVIATRTDPPLPLARLRALGQLIELRASDLSFTSEESANFLNGVMNLNLSAEGLATLEKRIEGWIAGLQLAALSLQGREDVSGFIEAFAGDHRHVADYLVAEVLRRQPEGIQTFLLQTSILNRLGASLCEAVTGQRNGQAMLEWLERANLFTVPLDSERCWYRYHHLFADFLRARLHRLQPASVPELHRRACAWYADNGLPNEAIDHALGAGEFQLAARLIERIAGPILQGADVRRTLGWFRALPDDLVRTMPRLCIVHAWALTIVSQLDAAKARLHDAERCLTELAGTPGAGLNDIDPAEMQRILDEAMAVRTAIAAIQGDSRLAIDLGHQALEHPIGGDAGLRSIIVRNLGVAYLQNGDIKEASRALDEATFVSQTCGYIVNAIAALSQLGSAQAIQGQLRRAADTYRRAMEMVSEQETKTFSAAGWPFVGMGRLLYEWNDLDNATEQVAKGIQLAREAEMPYTVLTGYGIMARVKQAEGDFDSALQIIRRAEQLVLVNSLPRGIARLDLWWVRLWLAQGNVEAAARWAEASAGRLNEEPTYQHESEHIMLARACVAAGESDRALEVLGRLLALAEMAGRMGSAIKILAVRALALQAQGDRHGAAVSLERALSLAEPEGHVRTFVDLGCPMAALLRHTLGTLPHPPAGSPRVSKAYVRRLLEAFGEDIPEQDRATALPISHRLAEALNKREREVLHLICEGCSNREIAENLTVSLNTVKTHVSRIFGKLGVTNRTQAAARARQMGLL
jgi:LuxR family maltose regulon positive regulatory protein